MQSQLQQAIDLVKKTGDRLIVFDSAKPDNIYVVMSLKDYENLVLGKSEVRGLTEDELLDKINRDIAIWKSEQDFKEDLEQFKKSTDFNFDIDKIKEFSYKDKIEEKKEEKPVNAWKIPKNIKEGAEEIIEEDMQYLEDIVF